LLANIALLASRIGILHWKVTIPARWATAVEPTAALRYEQPEGNLHADARRKNT
jgi:hypothetical protein